MGRGYHTPKRYSYMLYCLLDNTIVLAKKKKNAKKLKMNLSELEIRICVLFIKGRCLEGVQCIYVGMCCTGKRGVKYIHTIIIHNVLNNLQLCLCEYYVYTSSLKRLLCIYFCFDFLCSRVDMLRGLRLYMFLFICFNFIVCLSTI